MNSRSLLRGLGLLLCLAALAWIGQRFARSDALSVLQRVPAGPWQLGAAVAFAAAFYALALGVLAFVWWRLLAGLSPQAPPIRSTMATWSVSQYGKYLPGNVAHYALRHAWSRGQATSHSVLALAALVEAGLLLLAALTLSGDAYSGLLPGFDTRWMLAALLVAPLSGAVALRWARRRERFRHWSLPALPIPVLVTAFACNLVFFAATATILCGLGHFLGSPVNWPLMLAAGAASWAAGFVVIGAPAGLGVRETAFVAIAGPTLGQDHALLLIALYRLVTFFGDTLLFAAGSAAIRHEAGEAGSDGTGP